MQTAAERILKTGPGGSEPALVVVRRCHDILPLGALRDIYRCNPAGARRESALCDNGAGHPRTPLHGIRGGRRIGADFLPALAGSEQQPQRIRV